MNKVERLLRLWLVTAVVAGLTGCAHKPAYSDMEPNRSTGNQNQNQNQNAESQAAATAPAPAQPPTAPAPAATPAPRPSFLDEANGGIKDLPAYPNAYRVSAQIGPLQDANTMSIGFTCNDPMNKITDFFERVIKEHKWTVVDKLIDPEFSEWTLQKGENHNAKVQVKKDQQTGAMSIVMVRGEKLQAASK